MFLLEGQLGGRVTNCQNLFANPDWYFAVFYLQRRAKPRRESVARLWSDIPGYPRPYKRKWLPNCGSTYNKPMIARARMPYRHPKKTRH